MNKDSVYTLNGGAKGDEEDRLVRQHRDVFIRVTKTLMPNHIKAHLTSLRRPVAIADVATGTGIWLTELARELPADTRLDGYDFDTSKFPYSEGLPSNVKLTFANGLEPFARELQGQYDLVHVRLVMFGLKADQWELMAANLRTLLQPGGWLMWDEVGYPTFTFMPMTERYAKWLRTEVQYAVSVGRDIMSPLRLKQQISNTGYINCSQQEFSTYSFDAELQKTAGKVLTRGAGQSLHGMVNKGGYDWVQSHKIASEMTDGLIADIDNDVGVCGFTIYWITGQNPNK